LGQARGGCGQLKDQDEKGNSMKTRLKAPVVDVLQRAEATLAAMNALAPEWTALYFPTPEEFAVLVEELKVQRLQFESKALKALGAGALCDEALGALHEASVAVVTIGRIRFRESEQAPVWARLRATGQGHEIILSEGAQLEGAWALSDAAWVPKPGLTLAAYQALRAAAVAAEADCTECGNALSVARGRLHERANALHQLCVDWYAMALATFTKDSAQGNMVWHILSPWRTRKRVEPGGTAAAEPLEAVAV